ncbi:MAG: universal stress protein [Sedimenticola sp.]|nr:universal stress protein [Sedimenticola sp.]
MTNKQSVGYHSIIAAVTPNTSHQPAAIRAANVAGKLHSEVTLAHVISAALDTQALTDVIKELIDSHSEITGIKSIQGNSLEIITLVDEMSGDLIVLDDLSFTTLAPSLMESRQKACDHGDCDALIIHADKHGADSPPADYKHIVVAADLNEQGLMTIYKAVRMARRYQARLTLLNVVAQFDSEKEDDKIKAKQLRLRGLEAFTAVIEGIEVEKEVRVTAQTVDQAVCEFSTEHDADLIVMGSHKFKGLCVLLGEKAQQVIKASSCDVLIVHE